MAADDGRERRSGLLALKLAALVRDHTGSEADLVPGTYGGGAGLCRDGVAWVLADDRPERSLGPALAWASVQGATSLELVAEVATGVLARRAAQFADPPMVWRVDGRALVPAEADPLTPSPPVDPRLERLRAVIVAGGAVPVVEHGVLVGEVAGLEVCRAVIDPHLDVERLEVGVGAHDREAFQLVHGDVPTVEALAAVAEKVAATRQPGAPPHPLKRLGAERALRARLLAEPALADAAELTPVPPPVPRTNVKDAVPCVAVGVDRAGQPLVVVCSVGIDLDLVPFAADARLAADPSARLVLAVPPRDDHPITRRLAAALRQPADIVAVPEPAST